MISYSVAIAGCHGRMGRFVADLLREDRRFSLHSPGGIDRAAAKGTQDTTLQLTQRPEDLMTADLIIDFSSPDLTLSLLETAQQALAPPAMIIGTTGFSSDEQAIIVAASKKMRLLTSGNMSLGIQLLTQITELLSKKLPKGWDIEIVETHHRQKKDAPSGTALMLANAAATGRKKKLEVVRQDGRAGRELIRGEEEIGLHAVRGGGVIGDHQIHFISQDERLIFEHRASDRTLFARGAIEAAAWLVGQTEPGFYQLSDILQI